MGNFGGAASSPTIYKYTFTQSYSFPERLSSYRLNQIYYVSPYTIGHFRRDANLKTQTDERVE
jgi:hypothetical protein